MNETVKLEEDGKTVLIENVKIADDNLYQFLREVDEEKRVERLVGAVRIGAVGLRRMTMGEEVDFVEKGFNSLLSKFERMFDPSLETSHLGKLAKVLKEYFDKGGTVENMLDPSVENTPIGKLRLDILREIKEVRDAVTKKEAKEEVMDVTTLKGYAFEDACEEILSDFISKNIGDLFERTTTKIGEIEGGFVGDFVITPRDFPDRKIVLETKDWNSVTYPQIIENLKSAINNRGARYGIFVSKFKEALPKKVGWFNEYGGNMLVCALGSKVAGTFLPEILNIAYQWAKLRVEREITMEEKALETVVKGMKEVERRLEAISQIQKQCTNVEKATGEIRTLSDNLRDGIKEEINKIQKAMGVVAKKE